VRLFTVLLAAALLQAPQEPIAEPPPFDEWLQALMAEARERGYSETLVEQALGGVEPLQRVIQTDRSQAELVVGFDRYYRARVTAAMVRRGRELAREYRTVLGRIESEYDVQRRFIMAIWGIETRYGRVTGNIPVFQALATLAWEPRRAEYFRGELFNALTMVSKGYIDTTTMTGSWAGAMGHPQFMPSSYLKFAEDFDRDGRRDIWRSTPDALASIANYLDEWGWDDDFTWGREVRVTPEVRARIEQDVPRRAEGCFAMRNMTERIPLGGAWTAGRCRRAT
jgi:membrane-bound lytic murein transglycosylase B